MTCAATTKTPTAHAAPHGGPSASMPRPATNAPSDPCEHVQRTEHGPKPDGAASIIERRAARLRHANLIQRARFVRLHQLLSRRCSEGEA